MEDTIRDIKHELGDRKKIKIAINGFGRIGRMVFRVAYEDPDVEVVVINDLSPISNGAYFLKYDTAQGNFNVGVEHDDSNLYVGDKKIPYISEKDPEKLPWGDYDVDVVAECTGVFKRAEDNEVHIRNGASKVLVSAPVKGEAFYLVRGVNDETYSGEKIVSNGSCTTNSMTAVVDRIHKEFGIEKGMFSTVHSVTGDQRIIDTNHSDVRRGRAGPFNIIPTTTGAAKAVTKLVTDLEGKLHGIAYRVPTITGSVTDLNLELSREVSRDEINSFLRDISNNELNGVVEYTEEPIVSSDIIGNSHSGIVDGLSTEVVDGKMVKLVIWYDNEWGFSKRMVEVIKIMAEN